MPTIHVLDKAVAELIAAGEVVERPASIAKELIENCIDAGATSVTVEIEGGGVSLLRVADNGAGIARNDIPRAFLRHATSKLKYAEDLDKIMTLGFRGEALASIAAMSRVEMITKTADELEGTLYRIEGGVFLSCEDIGCPAGTTISVRDVFYNTPARMKFLKRDVAEGNAVSQVVDRCALSHPEIAFRFSRDGKTALQTSGNGDLRAVIAAVHGKELALQLMEINYTSDRNIQVKGYVSNPSYAKPGRGFQTFFISGRYVKTRTAAAALEEAYKTVMMSGRYPACVLDIILPPDFVDVNVHPAKIEVRFADEKPVFQAVYYAVKTALQKLSSPLAQLAEEEKRKEPAAVSAVPQVASKPAASAAQMQKQQHMTAAEFGVLFGAKPERPSSLFSKPIGFGSSKPKLDIEVEPPPKNDKISAQGGSTIVTRQPLEKKPASVGEEVLSDTEETLGETTLFTQNNLRLVGELFGTYILLETSEDFYLVDKHAAHERILYERLRENISHGNRQVLLASQAVTLPMEDYTALLENLEQVTTLGFLIEDFGGGTILVRETPVELGEKDIPFALEEVACKLRENRHDLVPAALDRLYYSIACKSAVRARDRNHPVELKEIVEKLRENPQITHCPHGRPVTVKMTRYEVEKLFGRQG